MSPITSAHTFVVIHERAEIVRCDGTDRRCSPSPCSGNCNGRCQQTAGLVPTPLVEDIESRISEVKSKIRQIKLDQRQIMSEGDLRSVAAECVACDLCKVCSGNHRRYSRVFSACWPPGKSKCFAYLYKKGAPIRNEPCALCEDHDRMLRKSRRESGTALSGLSLAQNDLRALYAERRNLVEGYPVNFKILEG